jgi:hypothetical protein
LNVRILILAVLIGPLPLFAQILPPGIYRDELADRSQVLLLTVPTNGPIGMAFGNVNPITGDITAYAVGEATNKLNGRITGLFFGGGGRLRGRVRDGGTNGVTGTFRVLIRGSAIPIIRRFHALP